MTSSARAVADRPIDRVLARLPSAKRAGRGWTALCPAHEDHKASLSIHEGTNVPGAVTLHCHAGCTAEAIVGTLGLRMPDLFPPKDAPTPLTVRPLRAHPGIVAEYDYVDENDRLLFQAVRYEPKDFRQRRPDGKGGWIWSVKDTRLVLYRLPKIIEAVAEERTVYIAEGEKDVHALERIGLVATCNPMGAGKWRDEFSRVLAGAHVVILPDNDAPGRKHAAAVAESLEPVAAGVRVVELPGLPPKGDVSDWIAAGHTRVELENLVLAGASAVDDSSDVLALECFADIEPEITEWLWPDRIPLGNVSVIDGIPGLGKSTLTIDMAARITRGRAFPDGRPSVRGSVLMLSAEDSRGATIRTRLDAAAADPSRVHHLEHRLPDGATCSLAFPDDFPLLRAALDRLPDVRLVVVDPLTAFLSADVNSNHDADVRRVLARFKALAEEYRVALVFVRHLNKTRGGSAIMRGGGSIGIAGAARSVLLVSADPDNPDRRVLASVKNNLAPPQSSLAFHLEQTTVAGGIPASYIAFDGESRHSADDLIAAADEDASVRTERADAEAWLAEALAEGPKLAAEVKQAAKSAGHATRTLERAATRIAKTQRAGFGAPVYWSLANPASLANARHIISRGENGENGGDGGEDGGHPT